MAIFAFAALALLGSAVQFKGQRDAAKAQEEIGEVNTASQQSDDRAKLRTQARQSRIQRAKIEQAAETSGGGSRESGAISSLSTQLSANVSRVSGQQQTALGISKLSGDVADARLLSAAGGAIKSVGAAGFQNAGGFDNLFS